MYYLRGKRKNGVEINREYEDINVAKFEYEVTKCVSDYLVLSDERKGYIQLDLYVC